MIALLKEAIYTVVQRYKFVEIEHHSILSQSREHTKPSINEEILMGSQQEQHKADESQTAPIHCIKKIHKKELSSMQTAQGHVFLNSFPQEACRMVVLEAFPYQASVDLGKVRPCLAALPFQA